MRVRADGSHPRPPTVISTMAWQWVARGPGGLDVLDFVQVDVKPPGLGEVRIGVRSAGVNPADWKHLARGVFEGPRPIGYEISGVIEALGPDTTIASGGGAPGDEVVAFRVAGGYTSMLTVPAVDVFTKPTTLDHPAAANLLLAGTAAAEMLHVTAVSEGDTIVVHGASGAVGLSVLQQARLLGVRVVGTASEHNFDSVRRYGGAPVTHGEGLEERLREQAPGGYAASLDTVGTDEAVGAGLSLVSDRSHIVTIAARPAAEREGFMAIGGTIPASATFRDAVRPRLLELAARGDLVVPVKQTYPLAEARQALTLLQSGHPGGKLALIP